MYGNELVTSTSIWTVGYVIGQIRTSRFLSSCVDAFKLHAPYVESINMY